MKLSRWRSFFRTKEFSHVGELADVEQYTTNANIVCACGRKIYLNFYVNHSIPVYDFTRADKTCSCNRVYRVRMVIEVKEPLE